MRRAVLRLALAGALLAPAFAEAAAEGDPRAGRRLAGGTCAACHGNDGIAVRPDAPNLAGQNPAYLAAQLRAFRARERVQEDMNTATSHLTDEQIANLAAWYAAIQIEVTVPGR